MASSSIPRSATSWIGSSSEGQSHTGGPWHQPLFLALGIPMRLRQDKGASFWQQRLGTSQPLSGPRLVPWQASQLPSCHFNLQEPQHSKRCRWIPLKVEIISRLARQRASAGVLHTKGILAIMPGATWNVQVGEDPGSQPVRVRAATGPVPPGSGPSPSRPCGCPPTLSGPAACPTPRSSRCATPRPSRGP